ncbi:MAG TPA: hydrogenase maturation protease [Roseiflexaceae bacterium]|nr:hydrogenase maturation protease [Roseiflexaceae bacterium]
MDTATWLVIGYGNDLRGDDAAGRCSAAQIPAWQLPGMQVIETHQLLPELAPRLAAARHALFLDAADARMLPKVTIQALLPAAQAPPLAHHAGPAALLAWARELYGHAPAAWWVTIPAHQFDFGAPLSPPAAYGVKLALRWIRRRYNAEQRQPAL